MPAYRALMTIKLTLTCICLISGLFIGAAIHIYQTDGKFAENPIWSLVSREETREDMTLKTGFFKREPGIPAAVPEIIVNPEAKAAHDAIAALLPAAAPVAGITMLDNWAKAWSAGDIGSYLSCYANDFVPADGSSRRQWRRLRHQRLRHPSRIRVELTQYKILTADDSCQRIGAVQSYQSNLYGDRTLKLFTLRHTGSGWKIVSEKVIEKLGTLPLLQGK